MIDGIIHENGITDPKILQSLSWRSDETISLLFENLPSQLEKRKMNSKVSVAIPPTNKTDFYKKLKLTDDQIKFMNEWTLLSDKQFADLLERLPGDEANEVIEKSNLSLDDALEICLLYTSPSPRD